MDVVVYDFNIEEYCIGDKVMRDYLYQCIFDVYGIEYEEVKGDKVYVGN